MHLWRLTTTLSCPGYLRFMLPGLLVSVLLASGGLAHSSCTSSLAQISAPGQCGWQEVSSPQIIPAPSVPVGCRPLVGPEAPPGLGAYGQSARPDVQAPASGRPASPSLQAAWGRSLHPSLSAVWSALPPLSAFPQQSHRLNYLETWPNPGATVSYEVPAIDEDLLEGGLGDY
jgi:hypothetical protein